MWRAVLPGLNTMFAGKLTMFDGLLRTSLILAATFVLASFDLSSADASCGDYVMVGGHGHGSDHGMPGVPTCHGPSCHNRAPLPALPTKGLPVSAPVDFAYWSQTDCAIKPRLCGETVEPRLVLSKGHSLPLLRPPCL
jgi:hypothetical protein